MRSIRASVICLFFIFAILVLSPPLAAVEPDREDPHHLRMLIENGVYLLGGTVWYFSGQDLNAPDWDLNIAKGDLSLKFFGLSQIRFDNNTFLFNQAYHPFAHAGIYLTARSNDMSPYLAFTYTFLSSLFWEYIGELREKVSINDMIVSPLTGMAWGEVAHQYGEYFVSEDIEGKWVHQVLTGFFALPRLFHDWMDGETPTKFETRRFHPEAEAMLVGGIRKKDGVHSLTTFRLSSQMAVMPRYGATGRDSQSFTDGNFSSFAFELQWSPNQIEVDIDATATIGGLYARDIDQDGSGTEFMIGGGRGYRLLSRDGEKFTDRIGLAHVFGPTMLLRLHGSRDFRVEFDLGLFFDFSAIRSLAVPKLVERDGVQVLETVRTDIQKHAYYFGYGYTFAPVLQFELFRHRLELKTTVTHVASIQGLDRFQEDVERVIQLNDVFWENQIALTIATPLEWLDLRAQWHLESRTSNIDDLRSKRQYQEWQAGFQSRF